MRRIFALLHARTSPLQKVRLTCILNGQPLSESEASQYAVSDAGSMPYCFSGYLDFIRQIYWVVTQEGLHRKLCCRRMNMAAALHEGVPAASLDTHLEKNMIL
jgi:hypothetical protein